MTAQLKGKRALVTGGNKGIGFAICQGLIIQVFEVIMAAHRSIKVVPLCLRKTSEQIPQFG